jgi:hypothetical protein
VEVRVLRWLSAVSVLAGGFVAEFLYRMALAYLTASYVPSGDDSGPTQFVILMGCLVRPMVAAVIAGASVVLQCLVIGRGLTKDARRLTVASLCAAGGAWGLSVIWVSVEILILNRFWP